MSYVHQIHSRLEDNVTKSHVGWLRCCIGDRCVGLSERCNTVSAGPGSRNDGRLAVRGCNRSETVGS